MNPIGVKVKPYDFGPPSLRPSSVGPGPGWPVYRSAYGRHLAGLGQAGESIVKSDKVNAEGIPVYPNELDALSEADDVDGNGVFDANLTHGNVHADYGVFQDHQSLPGYVAREQFYAPSEVTDITTGKPVNYVPGGAVAFQPGQVETYYQNALMYQAPPTTAWTPSHLNQTNTWIPQEIADAIHGLGDEAAKPAVASGGGMSATTQYMLMACGAGLVVGLLAGSLAKRKGQR
jgi:hypothetical protein